MNSHFFLKPFVLVSLLVLGITLQGQAGILNGVITDKQTGETLIGATVSVLADGNFVTGTTTDFDGSFSIDLEEGNYAVEVSYVSFRKQIVTDVLIKKGQVNTLHISLETEATQLNEVIVTARVIKNSDFALLALQKKAIAIQDGLSSQQISRTGSSNAADAMRQMTGAVVEGGKFIVMRGLGDRYSLSQLNGLNLPSTDPYRNSTSLDLIPSQMVDNIITLKTFTPDLPGNFSGGLVNITTKSVPDKFNLHFGISTEYNTQTTGINNFRTQPNGGKYDWFGFDDGSRDQPTAFLDPEYRNLLSSSTYLDARQPANEETRAVFHNSSRSLSNHFVPVTMKTPVNFGLNFSVGNRKKLFGKDLGYTLALNYGNNYSHYDDGRVATFINNNSNQLFDYQNLTESKSVFNPSVGGLFNLSYKLSGNHFLTGNVIFNNDAEMTSRVQSGRFLGQVSNSLASFHTNSMEFVQRQFSTYQLGGRHVFEKLNQTELEWSASSTSSFQKEPDLRYFAYTQVEENGETPEYYINNAEIAFPYHFFRYLDDSQWQGKVDITIPFLTRRNGGNKLKFGGLFSSGSRDFEEYRYQLNNSGVPAHLNFTAFQGDFNRFFDLKNFGIVDTMYRADGSVQRYVTGYHYVNQINAKNFYSGSQDVLAVYGMGVIQLAKNLKAIGGMRLEKTDMTVKSEDPSVPEGKINQLDYLYSLNVVYSFTEKANLRLAGSQTLARPNLRELAPFEQFDTKNGFFNIGNPALKRTLIQNVDLRYEWYPRQGELLAVSGFYKNFNQPIFKAFNPRATIPELFFINIDQADVYGAEFEFRKELDVLSPALTNFFLSTNFAYIHSSYDIPAEELANHQSIDPDYDQTTRPFQGQAPFIVNAILSYMNPEKGWEASAVFNVSGEKLYNIALFGTPDIYEQPFPLLNFKVTKKFADNYQVGFTVRNLLNPVNKKTQMFEGHEYIAESYKLGTSYGLSLSYFIK